MLNLKINLVCFLRSIFKEIALEVRRYSVFGFENVSRETFSRLVSKHILLKPVLNGAWLVLPDKNVSRETF